MFTCFFQPKKYIQGSSVDDTTGATANTVYGVGGAALALVVIAAGATALLVKSTQRKQPHSLLFKKRF